MRSTSHVRGFTLIELLAVIAIIGILASIVLTALNGARLKARDGNRVAEMSEMQKALEFYYSDHGSYPSGRGYSAWDNRPASVTPGDNGKIPYWCFSNLNGGQGEIGCDSPLGSENGPIKALVDGGYMTPPPEDPINNGGWNYLANDARNGGGAYAYLYCSGLPLYISGCPNDNQHYLLGTNLEALPMGSNSYGNYNLNN